MNGYLEPAGVLGHAFEGAASVPLLLSAAIALLLGVALWFGFPRTKWPAIVAVVAAIGLVGGAYVAPEREGSEASVSIVEPRDGAAVSAGEPVTVRVAVRGARIATSFRDTEGLHLHLFVDGKLQQMPYSQQAELRLEPGPHRIQVELVDNRHVSFDPEIRTSIEVTAE